MNKFKAGDIIRTKDNPNLIWFIAEVECEDYFVQELWSQSRSSIGRLSIEVVDQRTKLLTSILRSDEI